MIGWLGPVGPHPNRMKRGLAPRGRYAAESGVGITGSAVERAGCDSRARYRRPFAPLRRRL